MPRLRERLLVRPYASPHRPYTRRNITNISSKNAAVRELEVERKFALTPSSLAYLKSKDACSKFDSYMHLGRKSTHDIYFDRNGTLMSKGLYVRRRDGLWEAKVRVGGDFINSSFREINDVDSIRKEITKYSVGVGINRAIEEMLCPCADFVTERESWMINGFKIDVDTTDFGHTVGEVELTKYLSTEDGTAREQELILVMDTEIETFMKFYPQVFLVGEPLGKLSAYFKQIHNKT